MAGDGNAVATPRCGGRLSKAETINIFTAAEVRQKAQLIINTVTNTLLGRVTAEHVTFFTH